MTSDAGGEVGARKGYQPLFTDVTKGTLNESLAHPREVFRAAIVHSAYALIVVHNLWVPIHKLCYVD